MERKNVIIILVIIIIAFVAVEAVFLSMGEKEPTKIVVSQTKHGENDNLFSINVMDSNGNPVDGAEVNFTVANQSGAVIKDMKHVKLHPNDNSVFNYNLEEGSYMVRASFAGNDKYENSTVIYELNIDPVAAADG